MEKKPIHLYYFIKQQILKIYILKQSWLVEPKSLLG